jgi:sugar/nucleoside kinase (ribokinase family)
LSYDRQHQQQWEGAFVVRVASIGVHILDVLGRPVSEIPPGQNISLLEEIRVTVAGTAGGTAVDLAKLGAEVFSIGALGDDEIGDVVRGILSRYGVDHSGMVSISGVQTSATMLPIRPNGERPALHVMGANAKFSAADVDFASLATFDAVHVGGTFLMPTFDGADAASVLKAAREGGAFTTMDVLGVSKPGLDATLAPSLPYLDYFMPNIEEAQLVTGLTDRGAIGQYFLDRGVGTVILKMGAEGSSIHSPGEAEVLVPAFRVDVVDTTGCGDAYDAGLIWALGSGWELLEAARLASACGSLVATGLGSDAGIKDLESTIAFMNSATTLPTPA